VPIHEIIDAVQFIQGRSGLSMSDLFPAYTYRKLRKIISQIKKGNKMKKFLVVLTLAMLPSSAFAIIGFGIQAGQDMAKLDALSHTEGEGLTAVTVNSFEMEANPVNFGGYAFVDLFGFALEAEGDIAAGAYQFEFENVLSTLGPVDFGWARVSYAVTMKKNIMDLSIPFLAKTALNAGAGFGGHVSTPRASVDMVKELLGDDLTNVDALNEGLEDKLGDYLVDNMIEASGLHVQAGLRFKVLVLDTHLNLRYNIAENVYDGSAGFAQVMFKMGIAF
jgi:hypothetical protein|tara:strand:+ start:716 stop:1546 length:831 start_codon:yes stop_codon:yes gene_type:complete